MSHKSLIPFIDALMQRNLTGQGGFAMKQGKQYRPDATAWAIIALSAAGSRQNDLRHARSRLASSQASNGSISLSSEHPESIWPTPLAFLAWHHCDEFVNFSEKAANFLLNTSGSSWPSNKHDAVSHNTSLKGWPWITDTHSWIEPTAISIIALRVCGYENHPRVQEALNMLLDRQLPEGGWNYGNKVVFEKELLPMPETTGMALAAMAGIIPARCVERSLSYLGNYMSHAYTPLTLGWGFLGLGAYRWRCKMKPDILLKCFKNQERYGIYDTGALSLITVAHLAGKGFIDLYEK